MGRRPPGATAGAGTSASPALGLLLGQIDQLVAAWMQAAGAWSAALQALLVGEAMPEGLCAALSVIYEANRQR